MLFCSSLSGWSPPPSRPGSELVSVRAALAAACRTRASRGGAGRGVVRVSSSPRWLAWATRVPGYCGPSLARTMARQCLELGLLDEVAVDLVPVVMGKGRPYFGEMPIEDVPLGDPTSCVQGDRVTHLRFPMTRQAAGLRADPAAGLGVARSEASNPSA